MIHESFLHASSFIRSNINISQSFLSHSVVYLMKYTLVIGENELSELISSMYL